MPSRATEASPLAVDLTAVVVGVHADRPHVLVVPDPAGGPPELPSGPLRAEHRTLQAGLRAWVEGQTGHSLGYVEQLYTFGDRAPRGPDSAGAGRTLSIAYLALAPQVGQIAGGGGAWRSWYDFFPWEDWRGGSPAGYDALVERLRAWTCAVTGRARDARRERLCTTFGLDGAPWDEERALERYELMYEAGLVPEAFADVGTAPPAQLPGLAGQAMRLDHRRILATGISRLRGKIKYRPVLFELLPAEFTLFELQRAAEALAGIRFHKQNFRRRVEGQGLVEETGRTTGDTGGRPAKLMRFRADVMQERPAPGVGGHATRRASYP
jgi:hypothetical protein